MRTSERDCQEGKRIAVRKWAQVVAGMRVRVLFEERERREEVERGSKVGWVEVRSALRFCVMESSMVERERRRKSGGGLSCVGKCGFGDLGVYLGGRFG